MRYYLAAFFVLFSISSTTHATTSNLCWDSGIVTQNQGVYITERTYNPSCSIPQGSNPAGNYYKFSTHVSDLNQTGESLCALRSWKYGSQTNNAVALVPKNWVVTAITEDENKCKIFASGNTYSAWKLSIKLPTEATLDVCEYFPGLFNQSSQPSTWDPQPIAIPAGYTAQPIQNSNCWQQAGLRLTRTSSPPPPPSGSSSAKCVFDAQGNPDPNGTLDPSNPRCQVPVKMLML